MRFVTSLWTGTDRFKVRREPLLVQTLAHCLAEKHHGEITFSTDKGGEILARELGWNVRIERWLDDMPRTGLRKIWAIGKLWTLIKAGGPVLQFDGDVLTLSPLPKSFLAGGFLTQSKDYEIGYYMENARLARQILGYPDGWTPYNCGLIGGNDYDQVKAYAERGLSDAWKLAGSTISGTTLSMQIEQYLIGGIVPDVQTLTSGHPYITDFAGLDYTHLAGERKHDPVAVALVTEILEREFPDALDKFNTGWQRILRTPNHRLHRFL